MKGNNITKTKGDTASERECEDISENKRKNWFQEEGRLQLALPLHC